MFYYWSISPYWGSLDRWPIVESCTLPLTGEILGKSSTTELHFQSSLYYFEKGWIAQAGPEFAVELKYSLSL